MLMFLNKGGSQEKLFNGYIQDGNNTFHLCGDPGSEDLKNYPLL